MINCLRISPAYQCSAHRWKRKGGKKHRETAPLVTCWEEANGQIASAIEDAAVSSADEKCCVSPLGSTLVSLLSLTLLFWDLRSNATYFHNTSPPPQIFPYNETVKKCNGVEKREDRAIKPLTVIPLKLFWSIPLQMITVFCLILICSLKQSN